MDAHKARPLVTLAAAGLLLTGAACNGPLARRAARSQTPSTPVTFVSPAPTTGSQPAAQPVRTDDLETQLQQADAQLSQTGSAVGNANQNPQQNSD